jgi:hypothetical protein
MFSIYFYYHCTEKPFPFPPTKTLKMQKILYLTWKPQDSHTNIFIEMYRRTKSHTANPAVEEGGLQFENPKTLKAKDCLNHVLCFTLHRF